jgi:hypothetical protein
LSAISFQISSKSLVLQSPKGQQGVKMSSSDIIATTAAGLSALSLIISLWSAYRTTKLSDYQLRLSNRAELHKMLLEIDREMLHDPSLYAMFKSNPAPTSFATSPEDVAKQDMYVSMYLNLFEFSFLQLKEIKRLTQAEKEVSEAWDRFIVSFFEDCIRAKVTWIRFRDTYYSSFRDYIDKLAMVTDKDLIQDEEPSSSSSGERVRSKSPKNSKHSTRVR